MIQNATVSLESSQIFVMNGDQEFKILEETFMKNTQFFTEQFKKIEPSQTFSVNYNSVEDGLNDLCELEIQTNNIQNNADAISRTKNAVNGKLKVVDEHIDDLKNKTKDFVKTAEESDKQLQLLKLNLGGKEKILENSRKRLLGDLKKWKDVLGLELFTSTREGTVFTFTNIEKQDSSRKFFFHLGLSSKKYRVIDCDPPLPRLDELLQILNETNDLSGFVQKIRQNFQQNS